MFALLVPADPTHSNLPLEISESLRRDPLAALASLDKLFFSEIRKVAQILFRDTSNDDVYSTLRSFQNVVDSADKSEKYRLSIIVPNANQKVEKLSESLMNNSIHLPSLENEEYTKLYRAQNEIRQDLKSLDPVKNLRKALEILDAKNTDEDRVLSLFVELIKSVLVNYEEAHTSNADMIERAENGLEKLKEASKPFLLSNQSRFAVNQFTDNPIKSINSNYKHIKQAFMEGGEDTKNLIVNEFIHAHEKLNWLGLILPNKHKAVNSMIWLIRLDQSTDHESFACRAIALGNILTLPSQKNALIDALNVSKLPPMLVKAVKDAIDGKGRIIKEQVSDIFHEGKPVNEAKALLSALLER